MFFCPVPFFVFIFIFFLKNYFCSRQVNLSYITDNITTTTGSSRPSDPEQNWSSHTKCLDGLHIMLSLNFLSFFNETIKSSLSTSYTSGFPRPPDLHPWPAQSPLQTCCELLNICFNQLLCNVLFGLYNCNELFINIYRCTFQWKFTLKYL